MNKQLLGRVAFWRGEESGQGRNRLVCIGVQASQQDVANFIG